MHNKCMYDQNRACVWALGKLLLYRGETPSKGVGRREKKGGSVGRRNWREGSKNEGGRMKVQFILPSPGEHVDP